MSQVFSPDVMRRRLGGPMGSHVAPDSIWLDPLPWTFLAATATWLVVMVRQLPCRQTLISHAPNTFTQMCYSDVPVLFQTRGFAEGRIPYLSIDWEYPVLSGAFAELTRRLTGMIHTLAPGVAGQPALDAANTNFLLTQVLLFVCFLALVLAHIRMRPVLPWAPMAIAAAPVVMATGLINWDLLAVALTSWAILEWSRRHEIRSGVFFGLAIAAKFYPLLLLGPLFLLCLRAGRMREFARCAGAATLAWVAVNIPVYLASPSGWMYFWTFNTDRGGDLGSVWYVLQLAGIQLQGVSAGSLILMVAGCLGIALLILRAPHRPRLGQVAFLVVAVFLMVNKVYSPQYVLWALPLLVLARPKLRELTVFTVAELIYFAAIWAHLAGTLRPGDGGPDRLYWLAVFIRVGASAWLCAVVILDALNPREDPLREFGRDDEVGGVLDEAPDAFVLPGTRRATSRPTLAITDPPEGAPTGG